MAHALENELDATLAVLKKNLIYWQTWEAEYEGFKEELEAEPSEPSPERMIEIAGEFGSSLINDAGMSESIGTRASLAKDHRNQIHGQLRQAAATRSKTGHQHNQRSYDLRQTKC